ncbi:Lrp/AsnC ligand binding domain-containing protein [Candidatus Nitrosarchaeum limnium]|uniref:Transcriptional regulator, AsnC family n=1 Tax=Candidatus Nitrosarchaeum limnium BG20 TaxID=859192 RepID=S2DZH3_9ARCH|nr:Lrp/AsnC ligand binding domain-containing protein [Candidatus Nitrosarchaeum limnium]EPA04535.1 transcriptional regulator, AsnC family [Candidatus Nitrosarchaeum limnium BG20]
MAKAYVLINCDLGSEKNVISSLKSLNDVSEVHGTLGLYDVIVKIESDSEEKIQKIITNFIRKMPKIHSTMTLTRSEGKELFHASEKLIGSMLGRNDIQAYVVIHSDKGEEYNILKNLSHIPEVKEADVVFGYYDIICKIETSEHKLLENIITKAIRKLPHVRTTMTLNVIPEQES